MKKIKLEEFFDSTSTYLSGREQARNLRKILKLEELDKSDKKVTFFISSKITGISPSFFLALFGDSVKKLKEKFLEKYVFEYEEEETKELIEEDVKYGIKEALDSQSIDEILFGKRSDS